MKTILILFVALSISITSFGISDSLVISQVYTTVNVGVGTAQYRRGYIELFNKGHHPINIAGYYLWIRYCSSSGTCWTGSSASWDANALPAVTINPGQYFLICGPFEMYGINVTGDYYISDLNWMDIYAGEVALTNSATQNICSNPEHVVDKVSWGYADCYEGTSAAPAMPDHFSALFRNNNGCQDTDDNLADFSLLPPSPRNSTSTNNICGIGISPALFADPLITGMNTVEGIASSSRSYYLSGYNLSPAAGNLTITSPPGFEISIDNSNFSTAPLIVPYTGGQLLPTPVYVRIASTTTVTGTLISGDIINSGGGSPDVLMPIEGHFAKSYYNTKANLGLQNPGTWSTTPNGTGASPVSFTQGYQEFNIIDQANANYSGVWDVNAEQTKIKLGDGINPISFTILPGADSITSRSRMDMQQNSTLTIQNKKWPILGTIAANTTVDFAQTGTTTTDTIKIPVANYYNLKVTNGIKHFIAGIDTIRNDLTFDGVASIHGTGPLYPVAYYNMPALDIRGNVTFLNGATFAAPNDSWRLLFIMNGTGTQYINTNGTDLHLGAIRRNNIVDPLNIVVSPNTNVYLGGNCNYSGLYLFSDQTTLTLTGGLLKFIPDTYYAEINWGGGFLKTNGTSIGLYARMIPSYDQLRFANNSTVNDFTIDMPPSNYDSVVITNNVTITGSLNLLHGKVMMRQGYQMNLANTASVPQGSGSALSYVDGVMSKDGSSDFTFHIGHLGKYAPVRLSNYSGNNTYTTQYHFTNFPNLTIDPATLATFPGYRVSIEEYWDVNQAIPGGTVDMDFNYTDANSVFYDPSQIRIAHFDGTDWNDLAGTADPANSATSGKVSVTGVSTFSPFTFSAATSGIIPVKFTNFTARKEDKIVKLNWTTEQEINSKYFIIERSLNANTWSEITRKNAAGISLQPIQYNETDYNPAKSVNYYRLKMIDTDNKISYSTIERVYFNATAETVLMPNPATDKVWLYLPLNAGNVFVFIYNQGGQLVKTITTNQSSAFINLENVPKGIYSIKITGSKLNEVKKLIVR